VRVPEPDQGYPAPDLGTADLDDLGDGVSMAGLQAEGLGFTSSGRIL